MVNLVLFSMGLEHAVLIACIVFVVALDDTSLRGAASDSSFHDAASRDIVGAASSLFGTLEGCACALQAKIDVALTSMYGRAVGLLLGIWLIAWAGKSILRAWQEVNRIELLFRQRTTVRELNNMIKRKCKLPSLVIICGKASADGPSVAPVSPWVEGLRANVSKIEHPEDAQMEADRLRETNGPNGNAPSSRAGRSIASLPSTPMSRPSSFTNLVARDEDLMKSIVLTELIVSRLSGSTKKSMRKDGIPCVTRTCRDRSHICFWGRKISTGFHVIDKWGDRVDVQLPSNDFLPQFVPSYCGQAPGLFLPPANVDQDDADDMDDVPARSVNKPRRSVSRLDMTKLPSTKLTIPDKLYSKFIFLDTQSSKELGTFNDDATVLKAISTKFGGQEFLWEPRAYYDRPDPDNGLPDFAEDNTAQMVSATDLLQKAKRAAQLNSKNTNMCEPTFERATMLSRRDQENAYRVVENAIPRDAKITILAKPINMEGKLTLVSPEVCVDLGDTDVQRYRLRILKGHTSEGLDMKLPMNVRNFVSVAAVGVCIVLWAATGYYGLTQTCPVNGIRNSAAWW